MWLLLKAGLKEYGINVTPERDEIMFFHLGGHTPWFGIRDTRLIPRGTCRIAFNMADPESIPKLVEFIHKCASNRVCTDCGSYGKP